jgi:tetratricopeptide (TPR) repeat protein
MRAKTILRSTALLAAALAAWGTYEIMTFPHSAATWGRRFEHLGLKDAAINLYDSAVTRAPSETPNWVFLRFASLRGDVKSSIDIAKRAVDAGHTPVGAKLYASAIQRSGSSAPPEWISTYASLISSAEPEKAAALYLVAANVELERAGNNPSALQNIERSLALVDDTEVKSALARLYLRSNSNKAEITLRGMIAKHQNENWANYALGVLLWDRGRVNEAEAFLTAAAQVDSYKVGLDQFVAWRAARSELKNHENGESEELGQTRREQADAISEHTQLYEKLHRQGCDIRALQNWEYRTEGDLRAECFATVLVSGLEKVAVMGILLGVPIARPAGAIVAAEARAAAAAAARTGAAAAATRTAGAMIRLSSVEASVLSRLSTARTSRDAIRESIAIRKRRVIETHTNFRAELELEQAAFLDEINASFSVRTTIITTRFAPLKNAARSSLAEREIFRRGQLVELETRTYRFRINTKIANIEEDCDSHDAPIECRSRLSID